jgi:alpha-D-ribose 1-methylphosphonate 5-triphosphate synthase subunit PhnH
MSDLAPGFADAAIDSQVVFRAAMNALARPAQPQPLVTNLAPPAPLAPELAALALALADHEAPLWLDLPLRAEPVVRRYLAFHTGARIVDDPQEAAFALVSDAAACPPFETFALGSDEYPDRSTTLLIAVGRLGTQGDLAFNGPGIKYRAAFDAAPLPAGFREQLRLNAALFPRGVDLVFAAPGRIAALPRSSQLIGEA